VKATWWRSRHPGRSGLDLRSGKGLPAAANQFSPPLEDKTRPWVNGLAPAPLRKPPCRLVPKNLADPDATRPARISC